MILPDFVIEGAVFLAGCLVLLAVVSLVVDNGDRARRRRLQRELDKAARRRPRQEMDHDSFGGMQ